MDRRGFLKVFGMGAAALAVGSVIPDDPERLLWVPGARSFFDFGPAKDEYSQVYSRAVQFYHTHNSLLTADWITRDAIRVLENNLKFTERLLVGGSRSGKSAAQIGSILNIRKPLRYTSASRVFDRES